MKTLAIVILDWNGANDTIECLDSLNNFSLYDIYLLDNGSRSENRKILNDYFQNRFSNFSVFYDDSFACNNSSVNYIVSNKNLGFAVGNNYVANFIAFKYEYVLLLNNDTVVLQGTIEHMVETIEKRQITAVTCDIRSYYDRNQLWNAGGYFTFYGDRRYYSQSKIDELIERKVEFIPAEFITGCALMITTQYIVKNGLFTDKFFHGEDDFNLCYRIKKSGYKIGVDLAVKLYHKVGQSIKKQGYKELNKDIVHYVNRTIDLKEFYSQLRWIIWEKVYLSMVFVRRYMTGMSLRDTFMLIRTVDYVASRYDNVRKELFDKIMVLDCSSFEKVKKDLA